MKKYGHANDQTVTTEDEEQPEGIHKAAVASGQQELTPEERRAIIEGEE